MLKTIAFLSGFAISNYSVAQTDTCIIYVPNTAYVSGDCFDCHKIRIGTDCDFETFEFLLFDRWGNILFETTDPAFEYDPKGVKDGRYLYLIKAETKNGEIKNLTGYIYILN